MSRKFLLATLTTGEKVVSEFSDLGGSGQGYSTQVFAQQKPFNAWKVVAGEHPASGEKVLVRTRVMFNGMLITSIAQVQPKEGFDTSHGYVVENFEPVTEIQHGQYGAHVFGAENLPAGAVAGVGYPIHRDPNDFRRYVVLKVEQAPETVGGEPTPEVRYTVDRDRTERARSEYAGAAVDSATDHDDDFGGGRGPGDADDDLDDEPI